MAFDTAPFCIDGTSVDGEVFRRALSTAIPLAGGVVTAGDLQVTQQGTPNMSVLIAAGQIWVPGGSTPAQGMYYSRNGAAITKTISASDPANPRIDQIIVQVQDAFYLGVAKSMDAQVVIGTPAAGANLTNLRGKGTLPVSSLVIAYVLVPANATSIVTADIANVGSPINFGSLVSRAVLSNTTANPNDFCNTAAGVTVTLPTPALNKSAMIAVLAGTGVNASSPVTVATAGPHIFGNGLSTSGVSSITLGAPLACVEFLCDGTNWIMLPGSAADTGWLALALGTNVVAVGGAFTPQARLIADRVWLRGTMGATAPISAGAVWATVPGFAHPSAAASITGPTAALGSGTTIPGLCAGQVDTSGSLTAAWGSLNTHQWGLDDISYTLG